MKRIFWTFLLIVNSGIQAVSAQENFVQINGSTNINNFKCINNAFNLPEGTSLTGKLPAIALKVNDFDCHNKVMTKDFRETLHSDKYPNLDIKILKFVKNQNAYSAQVEVLMMSKSRTYNVSFNLENGKYVGKKMVKFSEFGIRPPKKMGGMIIVKDDLNLIFTLSAR
ncbi:MAG: hypothetical protein QM564_02675 [Bergeyella sp.]